MADNNNNMNFWGHLDALRGVVIRILLVVTLLAIVFFCCMRWIFDNVITAPCSSQFITYHLLDFVRGDGTLLPDLGDSGFNVKLINIELASQFMVHMSASLWCAFIVGFPFVLYQLWTFVAPGLYEHERRPARRAFFVGNLMFYLGMAVGYFVVFPLALRFLADYQLSDKIESTVSLTSYMDTFFVLILMMGLLFELPLLSWFLGKIGVLHRSFFRKYRKYAIAGILILAGVITPTSDIFTLLVVFIPIYALWEVSALFIKE